MRPLGIVFDLDGTIVLSHHDFHRMQDEVVRTAEEFGLPPGRIRVTELIGTTQTILVARRELKAAGVTAAQLSLFDAELSRRLDSIELEALPRTTPRPGAEALLKVLREQRVRLALFTRSSGAFCREALARVGLESFFSNVRTRDDPGPVKPSPEALLRLLREMDVPPDRAVFIGDHLEDARCAARAGVRFYGVLPDSEQPSPTTEEGFVASGAAAVATDLGGIARLLGVDFLRESEPE